MDLPPAAVLAGGLGTRLREVTGALPKVLAPVAGKPFLAHVLDMLRNAGVPKVILCTGYGAAFVRETFGTEHEGMPLEYSEEKEPLGTGGALRLAAEGLSSAGLLVANGDTCCVADIRAFHAWSIDHGARAALLLAHVEDAGRYGRVEVDDKGHILRFGEKESAAPGWVNAGFYYIETELLRAIPAGRSVSIERETFPSWLSRRLYGYRAEARFLDIGTPESYAEAEAFLLSQSRRTESKP